MGWFSTVQRLLPQHLLSRGVGRLAASRRQWISRPFIRHFAKAYKVDLSEAQLTDFGQFESFNDFFTRALQPAARPLSTLPNSLVFPADGEISQFGRIEQDQLIQAKGQHYAMSDLAGELAQGFSDGHFCTVYLAPSDYHRVHLPWDGQLTASLAIPGKLFSVNHTTAASISELFCQNERLVCRFDTSFGPMLVILVGAMIVASIETVWPGPSSPYASHELNAHEVSLQRGDEIGRFLLGSTVICCFPQDCVQFADDLAVGQSVRMGQTMARLNNQTPSPGQSG